MASILNPTEILYFDIIYYLIVVLCGPTMLLFLLIFSPQKRRLHDAYLHSGVNCLGMITHCQVIVHRGSITGIERRREHKIRYAYKAPGTNTIVFKDYVHVSKKQLERRLFMAVVLPGQPDSGVPKFLLQEPRSCFCTILSYLVSVGVTLFAIFLFAVLYAVFVLNNCNAAKVCFVNPASVVLSIISILAVGYGFALCFHKAGLKAVPGRVWMRQELSPRSHESMSEEERRVLDERLNERHVPTAEVVSILSADNETLAYEAEDAGMAPLARPVSDLDQVEEDESADKDKDSSMAEARVIEIV